MDIQKLILEKLLSKYELSSHYRGENTLNRRVLLKLGPKSSDFKEYDIEDFEKKELIHSVILELNNRDLIGFEWEPFNKGNIMAAVWLNLDQIESSYALIEKSPKGQIVKLVLDRISELRHDLEDLQRAKKTNSNLQWVLCALEDIQKGIEKKKQLSPYLPNSLEEAKLVLIAVRELCIKSEDDVLERVFSLRCYRDSKYFEKNVRSRIVSFVKKYGMQDYEYDEDLSDEKILKVIGISKNPEIIEFCGPIIMNFESDQVNFKPLFQGAAVNSDTIKIITSMDMKKIRKVMFIENRSNYSYYINQGLSDSELAVYHGGFYSPARSKFFQLLYCSAETETQFYHWGDIDLGGFLIFLRLKREIVSQLRSYRMDADTLISMKQYAKSYNTDYRKKLERALHDVRFEEFSECILCMLELEIRLEQEAFLL